MPSKTSKLSRDLGFFMPIFGIALFGYHAFHQSYLLGILAAIISVITSIIFFGSGRQMEIRDKQKQLEFLQTFQPDRVDVQKLKSYTSYDLLSKIAIDPQHKKIYFWKPDSNENITRAVIGMPYVIKTFDFSDLLAVQFTEDGHETASAQKDTHYTNYLLNKLQEESSAGQPIYPPVDKVYSMALEVIVNDNAGPIHKIQFYCEPHKKIRKTSPEYKAIRKELKNWFSRLKAIVHETKQNVAVHKIDKLFEENNLAESFNKPVTEKKTEITVDIAQPSLELSKVASPAATEENIQDELENNQAPEKPTSYFDQLVEKNRRQLRGDYSDE